MSTADPMRFAALAASMTDGELHAVFAAIRNGEAPDDFQQASLDEAHLRGILTGSETDAISRSA